MRPLAVIGHVSRDLVDGGRPRIGGGPWYAGRALRLLGSRARLGVKCGERDRRELVGRIASLGLPVVATTGAETTSFAIRYEGERRTLEVEAVGEPWSAEEALAAAGPAEWVHVAPLLRDDFRPETLAALGRGGRRVLLDGQGLVRVAKVGPLRLERDFDPAVLEHVAVLKLAEEEADALGVAVEEGALAALGVPEVVVTLGARGSAVLERGRLRSVPVRPLAGVTDPTGAGDAFAAAYLAARSEGHAPTSAARRASALVAGLLAGRAR